MRAVRAACYEPCVDAERRSPHGVAHPCRRAGWAASYRKAGNDRDADGDRNVRRDMHLVAMTPKPIQFLVSCRIFPWVWRRTMHKDSIPWNRGDVGRLIRRATYASCQVRLLERGYVTWGVHGRRGASTGQRWSAVTGMFFRRELMSSSQSFGSNFSCFVRARNESIGRRLIRMRRA